MGREQLASDVAARAPQLIDALLARGCWGRPDADARAALEVVFSDFAVAIGLGSSGLLDRSFAWWKVRVRSLGGDAEAVERMPAQLSGLLQEELPGVDLREVTSLLEHAGSYVRYAPSIATTGAALHPSLAEGELAHEVVRAMLGGDRIAAGRIVADELRCPSELLSEGFEPALREIGARWQNGKMDPSVEHVASRVAHEFIQRLGRRVPAPAPDAPLVAMLRAPGDEHSLGQDCLRVHFAAAGLRSRVVPVPGTQRDLVELLAAVGADAVALSCMLPAQLYSVRELVRMIRSAPALGSVPVLVGGGMFGDVPQLATQIGADATAATGAEAAEALAYLLLDQRVGAS